MKSSVHRGSYLAGHIKYDPLYTLLFIQLYVNVCLCGSMPQQGGWLATPSTPSLAPLDQSEYQLLGALSDIKHFKLYAPITQVSLILFTRDEHESIQKST